MNKKFKYKKSLLAAILSATLLAGCDGGGSGSSSDTPSVDSGSGTLPEVKPDPTPTPEPTPEPTPSSVTLTLAGEGDAIFTLAEGKLTSDDGETTMIFAKADQAS